MIAEQRDTEGEMVVNLKSYLHQLAADELRKPESQRRPVPTLKELARAVGIHEITMVNLANNNIKLLNLETAARIITEMRRRGFDMRECDLVLYRPTH